MKCTSSAVEIKKYYRKLIGADSFAQDIIHRHQRQKKIHIQVSREQSPSNSETRKSKRAIDREVEALGSGINPCIHTMSIPSMPKRRVEDRTNKGKKPKKKKKQRHF
jgi:hypothetical protein